jgi:TetR/AcrR family transcriptional repressor of nem operon
MSPTASQEKRQRIVDAAATLFHHQGYTQSSLADIAEAAQIPLGNVYYYFRTKEALVTAVVEQRNAEIKGRHASLAGEPPLKRLAAYLQRIAEGADWRSEHGCPMGGLAQEANKLGGGVAAEAGSSMHLSLDWVTAQFKALGLSPAEAKERGAGLVAATQGAILLGHTLKDPGLIRREMKRQQALLQAEFKGARHG